LAVRSSRSWVVAVAQHPVEGTGNAGQLLGEGQVVPRLSRRPSFCVEPLDLVPSEGACLV
jgi:hypothetical protein